MILKSAISGIYLVLKLTKIERVHGKSKHLGKMSNETNFG